MEQSFYTIYVLQNLLTQAQLEILLARLESWRLSVKAGVSSRKLETWHLCGSEDVLHNSERYLPYTTKFYYICNIRFTATVDMLICC